MQQHLPFTVLKLRIVEGHQDPPYNVATALTVYGIETEIVFEFEDKIYWVLQQHLPFTVLKQNSIAYNITCNHKVATALTVYGIETQNGVFLQPFFYVVVATALTVYGIETQVQRLLDIVVFHVGCNSTYRLRY